MLTIFARFHPKPGMGETLLQELQRVTGPTKHEAGCIRVGVYKSIRAPLVYFIHSEWVDEAAFEEHARQEHVTRFLRVVEGLITHPFLAERTEEVG